MIYDELPQKDKDMIQYALKQLDEAYKKLFEQEKLDKKEKNS